MNFARHASRLLLLAILALAVPTQQSIAAATSDPLQVGKSAQVRLLTTARLPTDQQSSQGMGFLFLVTPTNAAATGFAIKETRDFQLNDASYQDRTQSELSRRFEPGTQVFSAEKFFAENPQLKPEGVDVPKGAVVISITMRGAKIPPDATAAITVTVGYERQVEDFSFRFAAGAAR